MADEIVCRECDERISVRADDRARGMTCPACAALVLAPEPGAKPKPKPKRKPQDEDEDEDRPTPTKVQPGSKPQPRDEQFPYDEDPPEPPKGPPPHPLLVLGCLAFFVGFLVLCVFAYGGVKENGRAAQKAKAEAEAARRKPRAPLGELNPAPAPNNPPEPKTLAVEPGTGLPGFTPPFDIDPLLEKPDRPVYLADMQAFGVELGPWKFGKGELGNGDLTSIKVRERLAPKGLSVHPQNRQTTRVAYALGGKANTLTGAAGLNDGTHPAFDSVVFTVVGDGQELWRSPRVTRESGPTAFRIDVSGVQVLELRATAQGSHWGMHAVWIDPVIEK